MTNYLPRLHGYRGKRSRPAGRLFAAVTSLIFAVTAAGCASSGDKVPESTAGTQIANAHEPCPGDYLLVCKVDSPFRISNNRFTSRKDKGRNCGCEPVDGLEAMKKDQMMRNSF